MKLVHLPLSSFQVISPKVLSVSNISGERSGNGDDSMWTQQSVSSEDTLPFEVPPTTPTNLFDFSRNIGDVKRPFPKLSDLKIPYIREIGVKASIETLSVFFSCPDYKLNALQFWFLDVITDCLWKMQDEYHFPEPYQKVVLEWVLFVLDIISDPKRNLSRREFFQIFNEAVMGAHEKIQSGSEMLPLPSELYNLELKVEDEQISFPSQSQQSSTGTIPGGASYIAVGMDENTEIFELPKSPPRCYQHEDSVDDSFTEDVKEKSLYECEDSIEFYQPNLNTPERFLPSSSSSSIESLQGEDEESNTMHPEFLWKPSTRMEKIYPTPDLSVNPIIQEWENYLDERSGLVQDIEKNITINSCALFAIKDFVYDYFYETFQFTVVKLSLMNHLNSITQYINTEWCVPKVLKEELKKPKVKKEKKKKAKKAKKKTPRKKTKRTKEKKKKQKKGSKQTKPKKKKLTKEEKAEMARLKREQQRLEEELRKAEENRRLLFPLKDATDDDFFRSVFEHWVKKKNEKGGKEKKNKKGAKSSTRSAT